MGKLVLTRRAGETIQVKLASGFVYTLETLATRVKGCFDAATLRLVSEEGASQQNLYAGQWMEFGGGVVDVLPSKCASQVKLGFDFPRDVQIMRTEILERIEQECRS